MNIDDCCTCGHSGDDHGPTPEYPGSMACKDDDCDCIAFEANDDEGSTDADE